jgi:ATP-binding cassette, subfamily B, bacterial PglK
MYKKIHLLIGTKFKKSFYLSWFLSLISSILEIFSLAILSLYVSMILNFDMSKSLNQFKLVDKIFDVQKYEKIDLFVYLSIFLSFFILLKNIYLIFVIFYENYIIYKIKLQNGSKLFERYLKSNYSFFTNSNPSTLIRNLTGELDRSHIFILQYFVLARELMLTLFIFILLSLSNFLLTFVSLITIILFIFIYYFSFKKILLKKGILTQTIEEKLMSLINNTFNSIKVIKIFKSEEVYKTDHHEKLKAHGLSGLYPNIISKLPRYILEVVIVTLIVFMIFVMHKYYGNLNDNIGLISIFALSALRLIPAFSLIASCISSIKNSEPSFENFVSEISENTKFNDISTNRIVSSKVDHRFFKAPKSVSFKDVSFMYDGNDNFSLRNINFEIKDKKICGIIGESGSGKSTIVDILLGLLKPSGGEILFDEKKIDYQNLFDNKVFGYVPQNIYLNETSIKENIAFGVNADQIDENKIKKLLKFVNLYDYVYGLKDNINSRVNYLGSNLSGGQIQRLGIARSLYYNPKFLILDEATNSLDPNNEKKLLQELELMKNEVTFIIISHRDTTISACDKVYRIKNGLMYEK